MRVRSAKKEDLVIFWLWFRTTTTTTTSSYLARASSTANTVYRVSTMAQKGRGKGKGPELVFDDKARAEYLTGFRKRKQERKQAGRDYLAKKAKEEQLATRKELREARKQKAAENVREQRKAFGLEAEGESDLDGAAGLDDDQEIDEDDEDAVPPIQQQEYDSDQHHTHVVVESFDPEQEAFEKATAAASTPAKPKANGASATAPSKVEVLPPSSRRVNKAKANASLSPLLSQPCTRPMINTLTTSSPLFIRPTTGQGKETSDPHQEENVAQKRLHISGLTASFSQEDLVRRFSTFGTVVALDGLGKRDAVGQLQPYAYLTLRAPAQQIHRCINLLSGSVWKGATLRIGEAKPDYQQRILLENQKRRQEQEENRKNPKKTKRLPPGMGFESSHMDPVDEKLVENGLAWGWKRTPAGHLVRPLRMRPTHPLPKPSRLSTLSRANVTDATDATQSDQDEQQQAASSRRARVNPRPPTKAHRITIDPTRYGSIHLSGPLLESLAAETHSSSDAFDASSLSPGEWHCEEIHYDDAAQASDQVDHRLVRWQYTAKNGKVLHEEFTKIPVRIVHRQSAISATLQDAEDVMAQLDFDKFSDAASDDDLFAGFASSITPAKQHFEPEASSSTEARKVNDAVDTTDIDDLFADLASSIVPATNVNDLFSDLPSIATSVPPTNRVKVDTVAASTRTSSEKIQGSFVPGLDPEEDDPANFSDGYDEAAAGALSSHIKQIDAQEERQKTLALLGEMFGSGFDDGTYNASVDQVGQEEAPESSCKSAKSSSDSDSDSEDADQSTSPGSSSSSSSASEVGDVEMVVEAENPEAEAVEAEADSEDEQENFMADEPSSAVAIQVSSAPLDAKSRRAALLLSPSKVTNGESSEATGSFVPIARFDPGTRSTVDRDVDAGIGPVAPQATRARSLSLPQPSNTVSAAPHVEQGTHVSMSTLKEMFKPQDRPSASAVTTGFSVGLGVNANDARADGGQGFSLMDSLGFEFELEEEQEQEPRSELHATASLWSNSGSSRFQPTATATALSVEQSEQPKKLAPFFPSSSTASWNGTDGQASVQRWFKPRSHHQKQADWTKYKESLTRVVKKRHREAARKHKRNFTTISHQHNASLTSKLTPP